MEVRMFILVMRSAVVRVGWGGGRWMDALEREDVWMEALNGRKDTLDAY